jgi:hypothetical protein
MPYRWAQSIPTIYSHRGRANRSLIVLYRTIWPHKQRANLKSVTRIWLSFECYNDPTVIIDSNIDKDVFDWKSRGEEGYIYIAVGQWKAPSTFDLVSQSAQLIVFDSLWSKGLMWGNLRVVWPCSGPSLG